MGVNESEKLYIDLKKKICDLIYQGTYQEGERIPPERVLAEEFDVSRITVRKALELLEADGLIIREVGRGTRVKFENKGTKAGMDMAALVAPARGPFFSEFIAYFQTCMAQHDSLLLYVEKPEKETIENCIYRLYQKDIRNVVVWLEDTQIETERLKRLRALGMNMVFFDTDLALPYADCVHLYNERAVQCLVEALRRQGKEKLGYIGWDKQEIFSVRTRRQAFERAAGAENCLAIPWTKRETLSGQMTETLKQYQAGVCGVEGWICGAGEIGIEAAKALKRLGIKGIKVASVDEFGASGRYKVTTYGQDFQTIAQKIFACLAEQNEHGEAWKAGCYQIEGVLTERS